MLKRIQYNIKVYISKNIRLNQRHLSFIRFKEVLDHGNVHDLTEEGGPKSALTKHLDSSKPNNNHIRIISCGGDGTTGWILSVMDAMNLPAGKVTLQKILWH